MGKFTFSFSWSLFIIFIYTLPVSIIIKRSVDSFFSPVISFLLIHLLLLPFLKTFKSKLWFLLTVTHGLAHIYHPAFYGITYNTNYTPLWDFLIHAFECLCIYFYSKKLLPIGIVMFIIVLGGSIWAHIDNTFMGNFVWLFISGCGVFGVQCHHMLLNENKNSEVFWTSVVIWFFPYIPYLSFDFIPYWDSVVNSVYLFSMWFFNWFLAYNIYTIYHLLDAEISTPIN